MIDALYSGISALNAFQNGLNSESNNLANTNTIGYKADKISFADMMYQNSVGKGVQTQTIDKDFSQGSLKITGNNLDVAIEGDGFFILKGDTEEEFYSRAGNFRISKDGFLQNPDGYRVQGVMTNPTYDVLSTDGSTKITDEYTTTLTTVVLNDNNGQQITTFNSMSTNYSLTAADDLVTQSGDGYKTREAKLADIVALKNDLTTALNDYNENPIAGTNATNQTATTTIPLDSFQSDFDELSIVIDGNEISQTFDTDAQTTLNKFADKISALQGFSATVDTSGNLTITNLVPGSNSLIDSTVKLDGPDTNKTFAVTNNSAEEGSGYAKITSIENSLKTSIENAGGKYLRISNSIDTASNTTSDIQLGLDTLGFSNNPFGDVEINDGIIYMRQNNNKFAVAKISTALFQDQFKLNPQGNNLFSKTKDSGEPILATTENRVLGNTIELSNSDAGDSLVNLMVYQRAFEASSKSITTSDEFLKTAIQLKK